MHYVRELEEMGVASLKLEGRMMKAEYVATVTAVYRKPSMRALLPSR